VFEREGGVYTLGNLQVDGLGLQWTDGWKDREGGGIGWAPLDRWGEVAGGRAAQHCPSRVLPLLCDTGGGGKPGGRSVLSDGRRPAPVEAVLPRDQRG